MKKESEETLEEVKKLYSYIFDPEVTQLPLNLDQILMYIAKQAFFRTNYIKNFIFPFKKLPNLDTEPVIKFIRSFYLPEINVI